jgi:hypothetical protein
MRVVAIALSALLVGCSSGAVKGHVVVGAGTPDKLGIYVALWSVDAQLSDPKNPHSTLVPKTGGNADVFMGTAAVGTSTGKSGTYNFAFHTLDRGLYYVGAYLASPSDPSPDILGLVHTIDQRSLIEVDPDSKTKNEPSHDIFLGISAPGTGTIRGTVHASSRAANNPIAVFAADGSILSPTASAFERQNLPTGTDVTFSLFNIPLGQPWLFADAQVGNDGDINNDFLGFPFPNPIVLDAGNPERDNVDIWVDRQAPTLGSISGTLQLNAPVTNATVELFLESEALGSGKVAALVSVPVTGSSAEFTIPSVPFASFYLSTAIAVTVGGTRLIGGGYYPGPPAEPTTIAVLPSNPNLSGVMVKVGVGQILGKVTLTNVPATDKAVWVIVSTDLPNPSPGSSSSPQLIMAETGFALDGTSSFSSDFDLFGFTDATYNVFMVPVPTLDSDPIALVNAGAKVIHGVPPTVTVEGGNRVNSEFVVDFATQ